MKARMARRRMATVWVLMAHNKLEAPRIDGRDVRKEEKSSLECSMTPSGSTIHRATTTLITTSRVDRSRNTTRTSEPFSYIESTWQMLLRKPEEWSH